MRWWRPSPCSPPAPTSTRSSWRNCGSWRRSFPGSACAAIDAALKAAQQQQAAQNAKAARARQAARRQDPRPQIRSPFPDEPWLPQMDVLNEVIGGVIAARPPARDIDDDATQMRKLPVPNTHAFTSRTPTSNRRRRRMTRLPPPEQWVLSKMNEMEVAEMIEEHIDYYTEDEDGNRRSVHLPTPFVRHFMRRHDGALPTVVA